MIQSKEEFKQFVEEFQATKNYRKPLAFGIARIDRGQKNFEKTLQATFPIINWNENFESASVFLYALQQSGIEVDLSKSEFVSDISHNFIEKCLEIFTPFIEEATGDKHKNIQVIKAIVDAIEYDQDMIVDYKIVFLFEDTKPQSVESVYLKLYALSLAKVPLRSINLEGAFGQLSNVAWSGNVPIELEWLRENEIGLKLSGEYPVIDMVDKFPRFLQHIIPDDNTRILDSSKVRFGASVHAGTTVMPGASYINFNAGTTGTVMVEGRISSSAIVGDGSDIGGGASILGVLSGTDGKAITIGKNTLLGANSVTGIPLGDGCIVDAGVSLLAGTKIKISKKELAKIKEVNKDATLENKKIFKGEELANLNGIHYRCDSLSGKMRAFRSTRKITLNKELH